MITMKVKEGLDPYFSTAFMKLVGAEVPFKVGYNIKRIAEKLSSELNAAQKEFQEKKKKEIKFEGEGANEKVVPEDAEKLNKLIEEYLELDVVVNRLKINLKDIEHIKLTPNEAVALVPILDGVETLEGKHGKEESN